MIKVIENGNLFDSNSEYLVNAVNCIGVMGAGIAKQFADRYPQMYEEYMTLCKVGAYEIGKARIHQVDKGKYVINFPTMKRPGSKAIMNDIIKGLIQLKTRLKFDYEYTNIPLTVAMPALGCGIGGLNPEEVLAEVEKIFKNQNWVEIEFYMPQK